MKNLIKTGVILTLLLMAVPLSAEIEVNSKLTDVKYNETTNSLEFTLQLKAGAGYERLTSNGDFTGMNIRWNLYLEPGVSIATPLVDLTISNQPGYSRLLLWG